MTTELRLTALHSNHLDLNGKMVDFAGYSLPVHYPAGIQAEHRAVREAAGLFDVSHMGEFEVSGREALDFVQYLTVNDASKLVPGRAQYSVLCNEEGGILDDLLVYRLNESRFLLVVNAVTRRRDLQWIESHRPNFDVEVEDRSEEYGLLALQGPEAPAILRDRIEADVDSIGAFQFEQSRVSGLDALVARTGYTGEDGFELYIDSGHASALWEDLLDSGSRLGLVPAGLGARDTLRLEMGFALYGAELDEEHSPFEAGLGWLVKLDKGSFLGREALVRQREIGVSRRLAGIRLSERGFPRAGYAVVLDGDIAGSVTSGTLSPSLGVGIAMAYLPSDRSEPGMEVHIRVRDRNLHGEVVSLPFYRRGSRKR